MKPDYIPAFHFRWLTPWYDRFMAGLFPEQRFKGDLIARARLQSGQRVLDLGCGTGTLTLMIEKAAPDAQVVGLDVDADALAIARAKTREAGSLFARGDAASLPFADGSFDRVFASLVLHHLTREDKRRALQEVFRVLKPGGELHVVDFGAPDGILAVAVSLLVRWFEEIQDNIQGLVPVFLCETGFEPVEEAARYATVAGTLRAYRVGKPFVPANFSARHTV